MDLSKEIWHCELYKLQQQAPSPLIVKSKRNVERRPPQFGDEYHGNIDRNETEIILSNYQSGAFLIRDSQRNVGTFTLVIRFDKANKNYVLFYNSNSRQHYVGSKYFDNVIDMVQDGLIHMYIESRGAEILRQISDAKIYEATPFYQSRLHTIQRKSLLRNDSERNRFIKDKDGAQKSPNNVDNYNDSGFFSSLKSSERTLDKVDSNSENSSIKIVEDSQVQNASARCKSLYYSIRNKVIPQPVPIQTSKSSQANIYEPIFNCPQVPMDYNNFDETDEHSSDSKSSNNQRLEPRLGLIKRRNSRSATIESSGNNFSHLEKSHNFKQHTFVGPQWCDLCAHFMWGLVAQGVQCFDCGFQAHKKCSDKVVADCFPVMKRLKRVFGIELTSLAKMENRALPIIFEKLIRAVEERDLSFQGIYRISGNIDLIEEVKIDLDKDIESVDLRIDPRFTQLETLTGLIKLFLRQLPIPLITSELYPKLLSILKTEPDINLRQNQFRDAMSILNSVHFATLEFFIRHLQTVSKSHTSNCMNSSNLAIVFAPTLISKPNSPDSDLTPAMLISRMQSDFKWDTIIVQELIDGCDSIFSQVTLNES